MTEPEVEAGPGLSLLCMLYAEDGTILGPVPCEHLALLPSGDNGFILRLLFTVHNTTDRTIIPTEATVYVMDAIRHLDIERRKLAPEDTVGIAYDLNCHWDSEDG